MRRDKPMDNRVNADLDALFDQANLAQATGQALKIEDASNRLLGFTQTTTKMVNGPPSVVVTTPVNYSVDANGSMTSDGLRSFDYDASGRLSRVKIYKDGEEASIRYLHNALGQRDDTSLNLPRQKIVAILPDRGLGGLSFQSTQSLPRNVFSNCFSSLSYSRSRFGLAPRGMSTSA